MQVFEISVPKATPQSSLLSGSLEMGIDTKEIKKITCVIPPGHKGLAYLKVFVPGFRLLPNTGNVDFIRGDDIKIESEKTFKVDGPPYKIYYEAFNLDNFLPHTFILYIE